MSDSIVLDLGRAELLLANESISLRLSSEATLITPGKDDNRDAHTSGLIQSLFAEDPSRKPWIQKGHQYRVIIDVQTAADLASQDRISAKVVAQKLKDSKIWKSLGLEATSVETRPTDHHVISWILSLDYDSQRDFSTQRKLHKLMPDLPFHDTKPPPGVPVYGLESVHLQLALTRSNPHNALFSSRDKHHDGTELVRHVSPDAEMLEFELGAGTVVQPYLAEDLNERDLFEDEMCDAVDAGSIASSLIQGLTSKSGSLTDRVCLTPLPTQEQHVEDPHARNIDADNIVDFTDPVIALIDAGLRCAMLSPPSRGRRSMKVVSSEDFKHLSDIAPSLWSPGYNCSIADRAVFLPTISHAITNVSHNHVMRDSIETKVKELARRYRQTGITQPFRDKSVEPNEVQDALGLRLWQTLTCEIHDAGVARYLQPLTDNARIGVVTEVCQIEEDMLDEKGVGENSYPLSGESQCRDCEDLLDCLSEADDGNLSDCEEQNSFDGTEMTRVHSFRAVDGMEEYSGCLDEKNLPDCDPGLALMDDNSGVNGFDHEFDLFRSGISSDANNLEFHCGMDVETKNSACHIGSMLFCDLTQGSLCTVKQDSADSYRLNGHQRRAPINEPVGRSWPNNDRNGNAEGKEEEEYVLEQDCEDHEKELLDFAQ